MDSFLTYVPLVSVSVVAGLFRDGISKLFNYEEKYTKAK